MNALHLIGPSLQAALMHLSAAWVHGDDVLTIMCEGGGDNNMPKINRK